MISVGGCERVTGSASVCPNLRALDQLEFFAEFQAVHALQIDIEVGVSRISVRARPALCGKVHARFASEAELEARGFFAKLRIDRGAHGSLKGLRGLPALKEEAEIASDTTRHLGAFVFGFEVDQLAWVGKVCVEGRVRQARL